MDLIKIFIGWLLGLGTAIFVDCLVTRRERKIAKENRANEFLAFLKLWHSEMGQQFYNSSSPNFLDIYKRKVHEARHAAYFIKRDLSIENWKELERLIGQAAGFNDADAERGQKQILPKIQAIIDFYEANL